MSRTLLSLAAVACGVSYSAAEWQTHHLNDIDSQALCNDGSPGAYLIRDGHGVHHDKWVIRFMGGGWCINKADCENRWANQPYLMSTSLLPASIQDGEQVEGIPNNVLPHHGILSSDPDENPYFAAWNHVYLWYCSSDSHLGNAPQGHTSETGPWQFLGKRITAAMVRDLLQHHRLAHASNILVTGDSAGGVGVMNNAAFILELIRPKARDLQTYKLFVDAGWFLDIPSFSESGWFTFQAAAKSLKVNWNASYDKACEDHFGSESWKCFHAQYAWPHIQPQPLFLEYLYDTANLGFDAAKPQDFERFRQELTDSFAPGKGTDDTGGKSASVFGYVNELLGAIWCPLSHFFKLGSGSLCQQGDPGLLGRLGRDAANSSARAHRSLTMIAPACQLHESIDSSGFSRLGFGSLKFYPLLIDWFKGNQKVFKIDSHKGARQPFECLPSPQTMTLGNI